MNQTGMAFLKTLALLIIAKGILFVHASDNICPPFADLEPCNCVSDGKLIRVDCYSIASLEDLRKGLQSTKGIQRVFVDFIRAKVDHIPSDLFKGLHVTTLSFTNCNFKKFGDDAKSALEGLEDIIEELSIHFSFSEENELAFLNVSGLNSLESLTIEGNSLPKLGNEWFKDGPSSLQTLVLMTNFIQELGNRAFAKLVNLRNLWLTGNRFGVVERSMLPYPATNLVSLDLTDNGITSLPVDLFSDMPSLKEVILADNGIKKISFSTWNPVWKQLTRLYLEMNPLECDSHVIDWMFKLPRPFVLKGQCFAPRDRKNKDLKQIIDENAESEDDYSYEI